MNRTDRLYALREELRGVGSAGRTAERLAETFEVSVRTIKRDISALQHGGFPVWAQPGPGGGYAVDASATLPPVNFTDAEVSGLAAAVAAHRGQPFDGHARAALGGAHREVDQPHRWQPVHPDGEGTTCTDRHPRRQLEPREARSSVVRSWPGPASSPDTHY